jgi:hypothetical protein
MLTFMMQQTTVEPPPAPPSPDQLAAQIRAQVEAARLQADVARAQGQAARDAAREAARQAAREAAGLGRSTAPGEAVVVQPPFTPDMIPPQAVDIATGFFVMLAVIIVGLPLARAWARRLDRKAVPAQVDAGVASQLQRIENAVETMAIEVERISEAQRYLARLETERGGGREAASLRSGQR